MPAASTSPPTSSDASVVARLLTPPVARLVPDGVFDAFGWCASDELEWRRPRGDFRVDVSVGAGNPPGMAFVMRAACDFLPRELARLHVHGLGLADEWALAPYGIDDATDELYARATRPRDLLWLAAQDLAALAWGLHDWAHFHNHGPFEERAWTELQCDATSLVWMWINRATIGLGADDWERVRQGLVGVSAGRFATEAKSFEAGLLDAERLQALAGARPER